MANGLRTFVADKLPEENSVTQKLGCVLNLVTSMFACSGEKTDPSKTSSPRSSLNEQTKCFSMCARTSRARRGLVGKILQLCVLRVMPIQQSHHLHIRRKGNNMLLNSEYLKFWTRAAGARHAWRAELTFEEDKGIVEATIEARTL